MKKALLLKILSFLILVTPVIQCAVQNNDNNWQNKPLMRSQTESIKESTVESAKDNDKKIDNKKKNNNAWYKKPAVKYAIGGFTSAAFALYSFRQYMRHGISLPESNELVDQKMISQQNSVNQNSVEEPIQSTQNIEKKEIESNKDIAQDKSEDEQKDFTENVTLVKFKKKRIQKFRPQIANNKEEVVNDDQKKKDNDHQNKEQNITFENTNHIPNNTLLNQNQSELTPEQQNAAKNIVTACGIAIITVFTIALYNMCR